MDEVRPFSSVDTTALRWVRPTADRHAYELRSGDVLLARLAWAGSVGSLAHASVADGSWSLKRGGFLQPHVSVRDADGRDRARLSLHLHHGATLTVGGRSFTLRRAGLLVPAWQFSDPSGRQVVHIEPVADRTRLQGGIVQVDPAIASDPALPCALVTGWYFIVLAWFEDEAVRASEAILAAASGQ